MLFEMTMNGRNGTSSRKDGCGFQQQNRQMQAVEGNPIKTLVKTNSIFMCWYALLASSAGKTGRIAMR